MRTEYAAPNTAHVIRHMAYDFAGEPLGGLTTLFVRIRRTDGLWWNWTVGAFQVSPSSGDRDKTLVEASASLLTGLYEISWPGAAAGDYVAYIEQSSGGTDYNAPEPIVLSVGSLPTAAAVADAVWDELLTGHTTAGSAGAAAALVDVAVSSRSTVAGVWTSAEGGALGTTGYAVTLLRKWLRNRLDTSSTSSGQAVLFDDDGLTPLLTWSLRDGSGGAITTPTGSPARRGAAT